MNREFIYTLPERIFCDQSLTINDLKVYMIVRSFLDTTGAAYPSNNWIASKLKIHRTTAITCINRLCDKGYLKRTEHNNIRYLSIIINPIPEDLVVPTLPPSSADATPPSSADATQLDQTKINSKNINSFVRFSDESVLEVKNSPQKKVVTPENYRTHPMYALYQTFYNHYPKHEQPYAGFRAFMKLKPTKELIEKIILDVSKRFEHVADKQFIPLPASYLNGRHWEGEISSPQTTSNGFHSVQERAKNQQMTQARMELASKQKLAEIDRLRKLREMVDNKPSQEQRNYGIQSIRAIKDILAAG